MAFKHKETQGSDTNATTKSTDKTVNKNEIPEKIRIGLAKAAESDLSTKKPAVKQPPLTQVVHKTAPTDNSSHNTSIAQLTAARKDAEKQVKQLTHELDKATLALRNNLDSEQQALNNVVRDLEKNLIQASEPDKTTTINGQNTLTLQQRDLKEYQNKLKENEALKESYFNGNTFVRPLSFSDDVNYYILSPDLKEDLSDIDNYSMRRLKETFSDNGVTLNAITTNYNAELNQIWTNYQDTGLAAPKAKVLNMYQDLQNSKLEHPVQKVQIPDQADWTHTKSGDNEVITDHNQARVMSIRRRKDHTLWLITYYFGGKPIKRDIFDGLGQLSATQMIDHKDGQSVTSETFYRDDGSIVLVKDYDENGDVQIQLLNDANILIRIFTSEQDLVAWWLKHKVFTENSCIVLGLNDPLLAQLDSLHSEHLQLLPLITDEDLDTPAFQALFHGQRSINDILTSSITVNRAVVKYINDIRVSTIIPTDQTTQPKDVILPKLF